MNKLYITVTTLIIALTTTGQTFSAFKGKCVASRMDEIIYHANRLLEVAEVVQTAAEENAEQEEAHQEIGTKVNIKELLLAIDEDDEDDEDEEPLSFLPVSEQESNLEDDEDEYDEEFVPEEFMPEEQEFISEY